MNEKIGLYGGAFNPPTIGHEMLIVRMLEQNTVSKILFSPSGPRWDKSYGKIDENKRKEVIRIFYEELKEKGLNVEFEDHFLNGNETTTTRKTEEYLLGKGITAYHIFGSDIIKMMPTFKGNTDRYIEDKLHKIFIPRKGFPIPEDLDMKNYEIVDLDIPNISSTMVREMIERKLTVSHLLTPGVQDYITNNNLYA